MTIDDLLKVIISYNPEEVEVIKKTYELANKLHAGVKRQSGELYITHPLNVAMILAEMKADRDTICAALLHDVLEDAGDKITKEEIAEKFNPTVALLVDGVTKISKLNFSTKEEEKNTNTRKIITGLTTDVRIIMIKLADRLHNMRTLQFKPRNKQIENAVETMELFVPLAYYIGAYRIKSELEDLSFRYLMPEEYFDLEKRRKLVEKENSPLLREMLVKIQRLLNDKKIPNEMKVRTKNIYGIYKRLTEGDKLMDIHDLLSLKIMVDDVDNCYRALGIIHKEYRPINEKFKDFICNPKTNMYQSLHTTVFVDNRLVQTQIRTFEMDKIDSFGLTAYWEINKGEAGKLMQKDLREKSQFYTSLDQVDSMFSDNSEFIAQVKEEVFSPKVYIYVNGFVYELPVGATIVDLAYKIGAETAHTMQNARVNNNLCDVGRVLKNKDRVEIITDPLSYGPRREWLPMAKTSYARKQIENTLCLTKR